MSLITRAKVDKMAAPVVKSFFPLAAKAGLSFRQMATLLDVSPPTVLHYKAGQPCDLRAVSNMSYLTARLSRLSDNRLAALSKNAREREAYVQELLSA